MPTYDVTLARLRWEYMTIPVRAATPEAALQKARDQATDEYTWNNANFGDVEGGTEIDVRDASTKQVAFQERTAD